MIEKSICIEINGNVENSNIIGSCQNEIRFRSSEDQLKEEIDRRRKMHKTVGMLHVACDKCGSYNYVIANFETRTAECEKCWAIRRFKELIGEKDV